MFFLSLTTTDEQPLLQNKAKISLVAFQKQGLQTRRLSYNKLYSKLKFNVHTLIILTETRILSKPNTFQVYLEHIRNHKIRKTILVFVDNNLDSNQECELNHTLNNLVSGNAWLYQNSNMTKYRNIVSLQNNTKTLYT